MGMDLSWLRLARLTWPVRFSLPQPSQVQMSAKRLLIDVCFQASPTQALEQLQPHQLTLIGQQPFVQVLQRLPPGQTCSKSSCLLVMMITMMCMACNHSISFIRPTVLWHVCTALHLHAWSPAGDAVKLWPNATASLSLTGHSGLSAIERRELTLMLTCQACYLHWYSRKQICADPIMHA